MSNLKVLDLDPQRIDQVVISHNHYDHIGGLPSVLPWLKKGVAVFLPENVGGELKEQMKDLNLRIDTGFVNIDKGIWISNVMENPLNKIKEHALILEKDSSFIVITGCAHPGIVKICENISDHFKDKKPELVTGGFHLLMNNNSTVLKISEQIKKLGFEKAAPSHCTGANAIEVFKNDWGEKFVQLYLGNSYSF